MEKVNFKKDLFQKRLAVISAYRSIVAIYQTHFLLSTVGEIKIEPPIEGINESIELLSKPKNLFSETLGKKMSKRLQLLYDYYRSDETSDFKLGEKLEKDVEKMSVKEMSLSD